MTALSNLCINTGATELASALHFKLSDWIGLINWTHHLQSERHTQYFDSFVCSGVIKVMVMIYRALDKLYFQKGTVLIHFVKE